MCTVPVAIGAMAGATALSAYGNYQQQAAANASAKYQAKILERNAGIAERQAQESERVGFLAESKHRARVSQIRGSQRAGYAGAGVDVSAGTPVGVAEQTELMGDLDALEIRYQSALEAWAARNQASGMLSQASLLRSSMASPWLAAGSTLLGGAAQIGGLYASYRATQAASVKKEG